MLLNWRTHVHIRRCTSVKKLERSTERYLFVLLNWRRHVLYVDVRQLRRLKKLQKDIVFCVNVRKYTYVHYILNKKRKCFFFWNNEVCKCVIISTSGKIHAFFLWKKVQWRKNNLQRVLLQENQFEKKTSQRSKKKRRLSHQRKKR